MKFVIALVSYLESLGYNTSSLRKSADGSKAIVHMQYAEILSKNLDTNANVTIYDRVNPDFQALLASDEWNGNVTGTPNSFGDLAELAKYEARLTAQVTEAKTDMDNFQTEIAGEVTTAKEDLNAIVDNYQVTVNQQLAHIGNGKNTWYAQNRFHARNLYPLQKLSLPTNDPTAWTATGLTVGKDYLTPLANVANPVQCLKLTCGTNGTAHMDISSSNLSGKMLYMSFYLYEGVSAGIDDWKELYYIDVDFYSNGLTDTDHRIRVRVYDWGTDPALYNNSGWHFTSMAFERDFYSKGTLFDATAVTRIRISTSHATGKTPSISFAYLSMVEPLYKGGVVTVVDNVERAGVYEMAQYAYSKGVKLSLSLVSSFVTEPVLAQIKEYQSMGHFVFNHTYDHTSFNNLTKEQIYNEYHNAKSWMENNAIGNGSTVLSVPGAYFNTNAFNTLFPLIDGIYHHWIPTKYQLWVPYFPASKCIPQSTIDTLNDALIAATDAATYKCVAVNGYHGGFWTADSGVSWKAYIDGIAQNTNLNFYGIDDVLCGNIR